MPFLLECLPRKAPRWVVVLLPDQCAPEDGTKPEHAIEPRSIHVKRQDKSSIGRTSQYRVDRSTAELKYCSKKNSNVHSQDKQLVNLGCESDAALHSSCQHMI